MRHNVVVDVCRSSVHPDTRLHSRYTRYTRYTCRLWDTGQQRTTTWRGVMTFSDAIWQQCKQQTQLSLTGCAQHHTAVLLVEYHIVEITANIWCPTVVKRLCALYMQYFWDTDNETVYRTFKDHSVIGKSPELATIIFREVAEMTLKIVQGHWQRQNSTGQIWLSICVL